MGVAYYLFEETGGVATIEGAQRLVYTVKTVAVIDTSNGVATKELAEAKPTISKKSPICKKNVKSIGLNSLQCLNACKLQVAECFHKIWG